ncbi:MAG: (2Fe-2S) ferredoxin domain-containing protein, partial [Desulfobacterales bacterium]|nr:(2Fe-2S) ferredoxin domain-containing protein [Desulfobacterales bacterium]
MEQLRSSEEFEAFRQRLFSTIRPEVPTVVISAGTCGLASGAEKLIRTAQREILEKRLQEKIFLRMTGCHGFCEMEPSALIEPHRTFYPNLDTGGMERIIHA